MSAGNSRARCAGPVRREDGGFTLVEVLAAVLILSVGLLGLISSMQASRDTQSRTCRISIARSIAQSVIEDARTIRPESLTALNGTRQDTRLPAGNLVRTTVSPYPGGQTNLYQVVATVTWPEGNGTQKITYETLVVRK